MGKMLASEYNAVSTAVKSLADTVGYSWTKQTVSAGTKATAAQVNALETAISGAAAKVKSCYVNYSGTSCTHNSKVGTGDSERYGLGCAVCNVG